MKSYEIEFSSDEILEVRGVEPKESKQGKKYAIINLECNNGKPLSMYYPYEDYDRFSKGDLVNIYINYNIISKQVYLNHIELV